jgi:hypothetical protein
VEKARAEIADLERKRRAKQGEHDGLRSNATKKRGTVRKEIAAINSRIKVVENEIAADFASDTTAKIEDELESPRSYDHYLAGMKAIHKLKAGVAEDASRRGDLSREAARAEISKEEREADRFDTELQGRAKELAKSLGFDSGDAEQIALSASNGFTAFENRSLADVVEIHGKRTRESRVSQKINNLKPDQYQYRQRDLSNEQIAEFTKQYQEASLDDKNWLAKRLVVDTAVKDAIEASRAAVRKREDEERKVKEAEKSKNELEALANARERAKKYFRDERISKALKKQKPKTTPVKIRQESEGGAVKVVDGKTIDGDQNGELYPNGLVLHKSFEEDSKDFTLTHARSGLAFPYSDKKSSMQEIIGLFDILGVDFNVDTDADGHLPSELISRVKKINTALYNSDYAMLSEQDYATVEALSEVANTDIEADLILTADDLGANGIPSGLEAVMTDRGVRVIKQMAVAVPEFAYDPVFTVQNGKLVYRDGYEFKIEPQVFNLHPSELKEGQTVGINLEDMGIERSTPQDVVADMLKHDGYSKNVSRLKGGDITASVRGKKVNVIKGEQDNDWDVVGPSDVQDLVIATLKKIRWRQPGQTGDPTTDINQSEQQPLKKSEQTKAKANEKREQARQAARNALNATKGKLTSGLDAEVAAKEASDKAVPGETEFMELKGQNAHGVKQTIRVISGERSLVMERKHNSEWSIKEAEKYTGEVRGRVAVKKGGELLVSGIFGTKKAKEIAQQIIDGTFDKDADNRFVREDTQNIGLANAELAASIKGELRNKASFARLLRDESLFTDGRLLMKVNEKDRDAILKRVGETDEGEPVTGVAQMMSDGRKALSRSANAMKPIGYRGGDITTRTVVLQSQDGDSEIVDKALHDTVMKKYPDAVPYFLEKGRPVSYASNHDVVAIVAPMNMDKPDANLNALVAGKYDFEAAQQKSEPDDTTGTFGRDVGNTLGITAPGVPLAGPHRGVGRSIQHFFQRFFTSQGELPADVYDSKVRKEGRVSGEMNRLRQRAIDFRRAIKKALGGRELTQADIEMMNEVLRGDASPSTLPLEMRAPIKAMRDHIDALSSQLILEGVAQGDLVGLIAENMGVYATRSYRVFDNPKWRDQVPDAVRNRAVAAIRALDPSKSDAEVAGILESLLYRGAADSPVKLLKGSKLGSKDLSTFIARKDIPEWLRELWGEYKDAGVNYARSVFKMAHLLANQQFLNEVREAGLGKWLRTDEEGPIINEYGEIITKIAADTSSVMEPLNGLLTTPEIKAAFERFDSPGAMPEWLRMFMTVNYAVKYGKTVGSVMTHVRNTVSNVGFAVANGHWRVGKAVNAAWGTATGTFQLSNEKFRDYYNRLAELGIVGEDVRAGELKDALRDASQADIDEFLYNADARHAKKMVGFVRAAFRGLNSLYQAEDGVWKIYAWENEKARYSKAYPKWSEQQVEEHAANIVRNTYPTYSKIPEAIKSLRRFPLIGTFVSFPSEVLRTTFHTIKLGIEEMQSPETRAIGAQRLAGTVASISILSVLSRGMMAMFGIDADDDKDLRWFVPPYQENSRFVYLNKPKDATFHFIDLGYSDPHAFLTDSVVAFMRGKDWKDSLGKATAEFMSPFASEEILAKALMDIRSNKDEKVYNPHDEIGEQAKGIAAHLWTNALEPGTFSSGRRIITAIGGTDPSKSVRDEVLAVATGQRIQKVDVKHSLGFRVRDFDKALTHIQGIARKTATSRGTATGAMVVSDLARMEKLRLAAFAEMQQIAGAARRLGVPEESIRTLLNAELPNDVAEQLMTGDYSAYEMTPQTVRQMMDAKPEEFKQRFEAWNGQKTPGAIRSYIGPRLGGLDKDSDLGKIKSELNMLGVTFEESKQALKDYWKEHHKSAYEKGVLKTAVRNRIAILQKIYTSE